MGCSRQDYWSGLPFPPPFLMEGHRIIVPASYSCRQVLVHARVLWLFVSFLSNPVPSLFLVLCSVTSVMSDSLRPYGL